jgi:hypothetical protein
MIVSSFEPVFGFAEKFYVGWLDKTSPQPTENDSALACC